MTHGAEQYFVYFRPASKGKQSPASSTQTACRNTETDSGCCWYETDDIRAESRECRTEETD